VPRRHGTALRTAPFLYRAGLMERSIWAVVFGTFTLRFSTGLTGAMISFYFKELHLHGGVEIGAVTVGFMSAAFFASELVLSPVFGLIADRLGYHRVMELGPAFGAVAVVLTGLTTVIPLLVLTRLLEGASTAASVPSILGFIAVATAADEGLRGRAVSRFETATVVGLGLGFVVAGPLYQALGPLAFFLNAVLYGGSWLIYRKGVTDPRAEGHADGEGRRPGSPSRYLRILRGSHVWLLAPTWIAVNASLGLWTSQGLFQLVGKGNPAFPDQILMHGFSPVQASLGLGVALLVLLSGFVWWGNRFRAFRRTTMIYMGLGGGLLMAAGGFAFNHSEGSVPPLVICFVLVAGVGLFVLAGATPAALGLLADISERYPDDRGAIMGLYSVFLAIGQIGGSIVGGFAAEWHAIDGLFFATVGLLAIAAVPLWFLRSEEHRFVGEIPPPVVDPAG
jgi:MFS family permease